MGFSTYNDVIVCTKEEAIKAYIGEMMAMAQGGVGPEAAP